MAFHNLKRKMFESAAWLTTWELRRRVSWFLLPFSIKFLFTSLHSSLTTAPNHLTTPSLWKEPTKYDWQFTISECIRNFKRCYEEWKNHWRFEFEIFVSFLCYFFLPIKTELSVLLPTFNYLSSSSVLAVCST